MPNCEYDCTLGFTWWQVTILVAAALLCYLLMEMGHRLFDAYELRHTDKPIEEADGTPMQERDDPTPLRELLKEHGDPDVYFTQPEEPLLPDYYAEGGWRPPAIPDDTDTEVVTGEVVEDAVPEEVVTEANAVWWINGRTLHLTTCGHVKRALRHRTNSPATSMLAPVPSNDFDVVTTWHQRMGLVACALCRPLQRERVEAIRKAVVPVGGGDRE